ncbi:GntR family transcriptional regulator [Sporomusa acidovorans]|uniref:HTH-type transcriptional repressor GlaR n=1 Tax=Sporomusa acidovorans (strain ATCC 49682 / DSM 3132 / Mol) TaxID=1123286 RepID=A0ABZ3J5K8_SPOA4|nr:GntR family transcriptional regulator [Sporomusa acidovorans]OZC15700.1 HTH-type transcriptional regulator LutR [Sporomusa acidovorans DSM 3132]SDE89431.1 DNA-binding transcriptional regulator, GntR family [Sporomusa acidovorans]
MELPKLDNSNLWDKTYILLKERILRREFKPNQKLSIPELAKQLGVSRTPIRDALNRLEMDGLVKTVSKVGTFVNALEIEDILDIIDTRLMLELWVVEKLTLLSDDDYAQKIGKLENILQEASLSVEKIPLESYLRTNYNLRFHMAFVELGGNKRNTEIYLSMMNYHFLAAENALFTKEMVTRAVEQHYTILTALREKNFETLKAAIKLHLDDSKERLIRQLQANGGKL